MNAFTKAVNDIFKVQDFLETCMIGENVYECVCSAIEDGIVYGEAGLVDDVSFYLSIKLPIRPMPKAGDKLLFRGVQYRVSSVDTDSANASISIHLQSMSKQ